MGEWNGGLCKWMGVMDGGVNGKQASKLTRGKIAKWESEQLS